MKRIFIFFSLIFCVGNIFAQVKIEKSQDIVVVLGRKYYVHNVEAGQTIYSLSQVYGVPESEILYVNKEVVVELKAGTALRIPLIDENYVPNPTGSVSFVEHKVKKKQSLYFIAKEYNVSQEDIIKYNPQAKNGIKKKMLLKIPVYEDVELKAEDEFFKYHQVKNGDNLSIIALQYGVSVSEIEEFNENANNFKVGDFLVIPTKHLSEQQKAILKFNQDFSPDFLDIDPNYFEDPNYPPCSEFAYNDTMTFDVAFVFPFFINENYSLSGMALENPKRTQYYKNTKVFYDYVQGAMLAINKLRKEGMNFRIYMYDTKADTVATQEIFNKYEMTKMDLILGPVYAANYKIADEFSKKHKINIIAPLSRRSSVIENKPFVYKIVPSNEKIIKYTAKYVTKDLDSADIFVVSNGSEEQMELVKTFENELAILSNNEYVVDVKTITFSKFITPYKKDLTKDKHNIVFIPSTNEIEVSAILNNLNSLVTVNKYDITVYTMPAIANYTKLQSDWIGNLNIHYASTTYKDPENWDIKEFRRDYHNKFGLFPSHYSYIGYDITYYFAKAMQQYGKYFQFCLNKNQEIREKGIFMKFDFRRTAPNNGFENNGLYMMYYTKDLDLLLENDGSDSEEQN